MPARRLILITTTTLIFALGAIAARAQDAGALLDLLVKKKLITTKEAEEVRAEFKKEAAKNPAAPSEGAMKIQRTYDGKTYVEKEVPVEKTAAEKWKLSTPITELELYGDLRLRYSYNGGRTDGNSPLAPSANGVAGHDDWQERERERYRLRIGLRGTLAEDWFFGVRLEGNASDRSANITFGDDTSTSSPGGGGPFAKGSDGVDIGQAYLGYKGFKDITLTAGRMPNPLTNTSMVWDPDINPEGLSEQWKHTFNLTFGGSSASEAPASYTKDGKAAAPVVSEPFKVKIDVFANFAQFVYDDSNPENPLGRRATTTANGGHQLVPNTDAFLLAWQVGARFTFPKTLYAQIAPTLYNYTGNGDTFNVHYQGGDPNLTNAASLAQNQTGINSLLVFDLPWEIGWKLGELPMHLFGDFAVNLEADDRAAAAGHAGKGDQRYAFQVGAGIGQLKVKNDWQIDVFYQQSEQFALDPNLIDDDFFDGRLNWQGVGVKAGYALTNAIIFNLTYSYGWRYDKSLGTGGTPITIGINPLDQYQMFFGDLTVRF